LILVDILLRILLFLYFQEVPVLGWIRIQLPRNVIGRRRFALKHQLYEYVNGTLIDFSFIEYEGRHFFEYIFTSVL